MQTSPATTAPLRPGEIGCAAPDAEAVLQQLHLILEISRIGTWTLDLVDHTATRSIEHDRIFGYDQLLPTWTYDLFLEHVLPEDRAKVDTQFRHALATRTDWSFECRIRRADGAVRWIWATGRHLKAAGAVPRRVAGIVQDITPQKETEQALRESEQELERKVRERTARLEDAVAELEHFSYTLAHDMRAPLRTMQALGELLLTEDAQTSATVRRDFLRRIAESARRLDRLVTDALNYSKVIREQPELTAVDIEALLRGLIESYPQLRPPRATITIAPGIPAVLGNEARLTQCCSNLLENAVKFVAPGTQPVIDVSAERRGEAVRLWFADNGLGIAPEDQTQIWEMFHQLDKSRGGTGIGLALVRKVTERMQGRAGVESTPGQGSRFWIELKPAAPVPGER